MGVELGLSHGERYIVWDCSRRGCWGRCWGLRRSRWQRNGENYITRNFVFCTHQIFGWSNQEEWECRACSTYGRQGTFRWGDLGGL